MPQTTVLPQYKADYPILAKVQKPGGVTVSTTLIATAVPNKPTYTAGTIQMASLSAEEDTGLKTEEEVGEEVSEEEVIEENEEEETIEHDENGHPKPRRSKPHRRVKSRR